MLIMICAQQFKRPFTGGVDVYAEQLATALSDLGHEIAILALDPIVEGAGSQSSSDTDLREPYVVRRLKFNLTDRPKEIFDSGYDPIMGGEITRVLQDVRPDLFIIMNFYLPTLAAVESAKHLAIPVVHIATDFLPVCRRATFIRWNGEPCQVGESVKNCSACFVSANPLGRLVSSSLGQLPEETLVSVAQRNAANSKFHPINLIRPYLSQVATMEKRMSIIQPLREMIDVVLAPTEYTRAMFLANGFRRDQVKLLPFGVDRAQELNNATPSRAPHTRFLFIGRFQPYKGLHLLLEAFDQLRDPKEATLTLYGAPDGHEGYFARAARLIELNPRIKFDGKISPDQLPRVFSHADYLVLPSLWHENSPLVVLDSLRNQTPVIASDIAGIRDLIIDGENGLLFPMGDQNELRKLMKRAIDEPGLSDRLSAPTTLPEIRDYAIGLLASINLN